MKTLTILIMTILTITVISAQTPDEAGFLMENETGVGVRAMGMGNAFISVADDARSGPA